LEASIRAGLTQESTKTRKHGVRKLKTFKTSSKKRNHHKREEYRKIQELFNRDKKRLGRKIRGGPDATSCDIPLEALYHKYQGVFNKPSQVCDNNQWPPPVEPANIGSRSEELTLDEVTKALKSFKKDSSPGTDKISVQHLWNICNKDPCILARIFNLWLKHKHIPNDLKESRTILLPKTDDPELLKEPSNWRPITIGSIWLRAYTKILTDRLSKAVTINTRQRGFITAPGCEENVFILNNLINGSKENKKTIAVCFVNLAKAFDTVSHDHIVKSMQRLKVHQHFIDVIVDLYQQCHTCIEVGSERTNRIEMTSGVNQGDPLSPILFNIAMDPLICDLENSGHGFTFGQEEQTVTALAFADDIALVSQSHTDMANLLKRTSTFCKKVGMTLNYKKTRGFKGKTYVVNSRCKWKIDNNEITLTPGEHEKYLSAYFDPWVGLKPEQSRAWENLRNLESLLLKPGQKVYCLKTYVIPSLLYGLLQSDWNKHTLVEMDRKVLHLALSTADGLLYSAPKDGGLGIQKLESLIPHLIYNKLARFNKSEDNIIHTSADFNDIHIATEMIKLISTGDANPWSHWRKQELARWKELRCQGIGVSYFEDDSVSNSWCTDLSKFKLKHLIAALQLRSNTYPTREFSARGRPTVPKMCRGCGNATETLGHISGQCITVKGARIKRHNKIAEQLIRKAEKIGWTTLQEPNLIDTQGRLRKPDLIFQKGDQALVVDVTVRVEDNQSSLEKAFQEKIDYYSSLKPQIEQLTGCTNIGFYGFVVGARG
uniref:ribonuclease H n=1 Tax=Latimeria chalumnae TaxID=7897 RepID=H3ABZ5_LATCH